MSLSDVGKDTNNANGKARLLPLHYEAEPAKTRRNLRAFRSFRRIAAEGLARPSRHLAGPAVSVSAQVTKFYQAVARLSRTPMPGRK